jgi:hypothetical protein
LTEKGILAKNNCWNLEFPDTENRL